METRGRDQRITRRHEHCSSADDYKRCNADQHAAQPPKLTSLVAT